MSSSDTLEYYKRHADALARGPQLYGGNAAIVELRCFKWYHPDSGSWLTAPDGKDRWFGPKTMRIYAILHRNAGKGRVTMTAIAKEAGCCASTVSRAVTRLQAFGFFAIDVTRGRGGGINVQLRTFRDHLKRYAEAAWARIRSWINVASTQPETEKGPTDYLPTMDATFSREARIEFAGGRVLDGSWSIDYARAFVEPTGERRSDADLADERATAWALEVIAERARLDREDPDWDLELEQARERWLH